MFHYFQVLHYLKVERFWLIDKGPISDCNSLYGRDFLILSKIFTSSLLINNNNMKSLFTVFPYVGHTYEHSTYAHY